MQSQQHKAKKPRQCTVPTQAKIAERYMCYLDGNQVTVCNRMRACA